MSHSTPNVSDAVKSKGNTFSLVVFEFYIKFQCILKFCCFSARLSKIPFAVEKLKETSSSFTINTNGVAKNSSQKFRPRTPDMPKVFMIRI